MRDFHGIIFAYKAAPELGELTRLRTAASLPFCGRYRLIDFSLSAMRNAGKLNDCAGILIGDFADCDAEDDCHSDSREQTEFDFFHFFTSV